MILSQAHIAVKKCGRASIRRRASNRINTVWPICLHYTILPWMTLKSQIKVIEFLAVCFS